MTAWWYKVLNKAANLIFLVLVGMPVWKKTEHKPLICAIILPLSRAEPWRHKGTMRTTRVLRTLPELWKDDFARTGSVLRELLGKARDLAAM